MQLAFAIAERLQCAHGLDDIVAIGARLAVALPHVMQALRKGQPAGILHMAAVDDVADRRHPLPGFVLELDLAHGLDIDARDLLAPAQIIDGLFACRRRHPIGDAPAHAAAIEPEHRPGRSGVPRCTKEKTQSERCRPIRRAGMRSR